MATLHRYALNYGSKLLCAHGTGTLSDTRHSSFSAMRHSSRQHTLCRVTSSRQVPDHCTVPSLEVVPTTLAKQFSRPKITRILLLISLHGIAMPPAGLCFTDVTFFNVALSIDNGWTDCNADCCVNTVD